ncbi:MAG: dihydroneopterin aldolase [Beijerinckiaceae bacterium]|jgi:7,8-dihydroneopterin aldolase/epimerase/oxygenase|nr:dihydroneopterin aldolase [Beijerinckiaceae bacterium]MDO9440426.1 dihydroneopterin aldolase [Beijerinckiaceae bacterium]
MIAKVLIEALELHAYHGWHRHEGEFGQAFLVDLELETDISRAAATDELGDTLDYARLVDTVRRLFVDTRYKLVETAAATLAKGILAEFPTVLSVDLRVRKLKPPIPERLVAVGIHLRLDRGAQ